MIGVLKTGDRVGVHAIMRQGAAGFVIGTMMELLRVVAEHLTLTLDVVEHSNFLMHELHNPNGTGICLRTRTSDVPIEAQGENWITSDVSDAILLTCLG